MVSLVSCWKNDGQTVSRGGALLGLDWMEKDERFDDGKHRTTITRIKRQQTLPYSHRLGIWTVVVFVDSCEKKKTKVLTESFIDA
mmetsp:Transcript_24708/g.34530  ORF Transcript_24708/g.34530 Transcript_24708/m.34530 type:complete len:85 (+) Transcript_24708:188-442(+)